MSCYRKWAQSSSDSSSQEHENAGCACCKLMNIYIQRLQSRNPPSHHFQCHIHGLRSMTQLSTKVPYYHAHVLLIYQYWDFSVSTLFLTISAQAACRRHDNEGSFGQSNYPTTCWDMTCKSSRDSINIGEVVAKRWYKSCKLGDPEYYQRSHIDYLGKTR